MITLVHYLWILLSGLVSVTCTFCFLHPEWFQNPDFSDSLGIYAYCVSDHRLPAHSKRCGFYGGQETAAVQMTSKVWHATFLLYGGACVFMCIATVLSVVSICVKKSYKKSVITFTRYLQISSFVFLSSGLLTFPFCLDSTYFRYYCGRKSAIFYSEDCHIAWAYMLAIAGTALSIFSPVLSLFTDQHSEENPDRDKVYV